MAQNLIKARLTNYYEKFTISHEQLLQECFLQTDLGQLYVAIPFERLAKQVPAPKIR